MAVAIGVQVTGIKDVVTRLNRLGEETKKLTRNAINDTARHVRTEAVRSIRTEWNIKAKTARDQFSIRRATLADMEAVVTASGSPIGLIHFGAKQTSQGVTYRGKRTGKNFVRSAFFATMKSGHRGVFIRQYKTRKQGTPFADLPERRVISGTWAGITYRPQLPILERMMPAIHMMWSPYVDAQMPKASAFLKRRILQLLAKEKARR